MDELEELGQANPVAVEDVRDLVAVDRHSLIQALGAGDASHATTSDAGVRRFAATRRPAMAIASALTAAAVVVFAVLALGDRFEGRDVVETVSDGPCFALATPDQQTIGAMAKAASFDYAVDLLSVHFDYAHLDDGHAALATREVATRFGLAPLVVAGTQTPDSDSFVHDYDALMNAAWDNRWLDAGIDRAGAQSESLGRWLSTLDAGGHVWVAEGGVSDYTAEVVREVSIKRPDLDTTKVIHVVQHSERNESETRADDLAFVVANTTYERIDDGTAHNGTANLNAPSDLFEEAALSGCHGDGWVVGFDDLTAAELDFSDTVTLLHVLGIGVEQVGNPDEFATYFLTNPASTK